MAKIDQVLIPGLIIRESANDGSDFSNPTADYRVLFLGEDGLLHVRDSSGTVTDPYTAGGGGISSGTSFPGSPATDDIFYRSDRDLLYFYDGTRWLTVQEYVLPLATQEQLLGSANTNMWWYGAIDNATYDFYCTHIAISTTVLPTNNGSNYHSVAITRNPSNTSLGSFNTSADAASTNVRHDQTVNALLGTSDRFIQITTTKTSSAGGLYLFGNAVGRKVG